MSGQFLGRRLYGEKTTLRIAGVADPFHIDTNIDTGRR